MNKSLLYSIVKSCEASYANVRGIICDMGNSKLLKELCIYSEHKHFFENPADVKRKVYVFPDVPHCLKNLRNHCLDHNLVKKTGEKIVCLTKQHFVELISNDQNDFKLCPKLSYVHVDCKGNDRQRVKYAVQLLSNTVSKAFVFKFGDSFLEQAKIISVIDAWFDVMDSRSKFHWKPNKCGLGVHEEKQIEALRNMEDLVNSMYFGKDETSLSKKPFQIGIVVSINSTLDLYTELKKEGLSYLLTSRVNQDALENVFSQIRALGGNNTHPTSVETINRIRTICLTKNVSTILSSSCPVEQNTCDDDDGFLSVNLLDDILSDVGEGPDSTEDTILDQDFMGNEPRNYVAGYISKKLSILSNGKPNLNSWIHVKGQYHEQCNECSQTKNITHSAEKPVRCRLLLNFMQFPTFSYCTQ
jgi:hypothetical protein